MDNIIDFSENALDRSVGKSVADIVNNIFNIIGNNATESISFVFRYGDLSIHIYKTKTDEAATDET